MTVIRGVDVDERGRCAHWRTERDVVAHRCETCERFWACHECHRALADHPFGRADPAVPATVLCGACGHLSSYEDYSAAPFCAGCGHPFNPRCALHRGLYVT